ncbi:MAG TPA: hypothetical protein VFV38_19140 [Ktedonobacteraceae bacterium]|nr:hypothetical protein [Ktedonobacteraceae bacterium]
MSDQDAGQKKDDEKKKETEAEAILRIVKDPAFDEGVKMGTVPNTPFRKESPDDPDTDKHPAQPSPKKE